MTATLALAVIVAAGLGFKIRPAPSADGPVPCIGDCVPRAQLKASQRRSYKRILGWRRMERDRNRWKRVAFSAPSLSNAIALASIVYRVPASTLWRRAKCESHLKRYAHNRSGATGYWQFLPSTWRSTPFAGFSIFDTYAQAFAAGWMMGPAGRSGEWVCR